MPKRHVLVVFAFLAAFAVAKPARAQYLEGILYIIGSAVVGPVCLVGNAACLATDDDDPTI